jgi:flagellin-like protein
VFAPTFFGELVNRLFVRRRAVSEIVGAVLVAMITIAMSAAYVMAGRSTAQSQALSMVDLIRAAERRQRQLLSLTYFYKDGSNLYLYIYNYGSEASTPDKLYISGSAYSYSIYQEYGGTVGNGCIDPKELVVLKTTIDPLLSQFDAIFTTKEGGIFIWRINV